MIEARAKAQRWRIVRRRRSRRRHPSRGVSSGGSGIWLPSTTYRIHYSYVVGTQTYPSFLL